MPCNMFSNIPSLYPLDANGTFPNCDNQKCLQVFSNVPRVQNCQQLRTSDLQYDYQNNRDFNLENPPRLYLM